MISPERPVKPAAIIQSSFFFSERKEEDDNTAMSSTDKAECGRGDHRGEYT